MYRCAGQSRPAGTFIRRQAAGSGLRGMSERLSAVGGTLELRPDAHPGFCLIATVPAAAETAEEAAPASAGSHRRSRRLARRPVTLPPRSGPRDHGKLTP